MGNSLLTIDMVTREALRVLHQKLKFIRTINREYDDQFAKEGAKIGNTLRVRKPPMYTVSSGATFVAQDTTETYVNLPVTNQKHVPLAFTSAEFALNIDDFSERFLNPAMAVLAANIEADVLSTVSPTVYNVVNNIGAACSYSKILQGRKQMVDNLTPDGDWACQLNTQDNIDLVDSLKGILTPSKQVGDQYVDGCMGEAAGFKFFENTLLSSSTTGTATMTGYLVNSTAQTGSTLTVDGGTGGWAAGDVFTIAGVYRLHPETKSNTGELQQFVVQTTVAGPATSLSIQPAITTSGAFANVSNPPADNSAITKVGSTSQVYKPSLLYQKNAFTFATADLPLPKGVDFASRQVFDGISLRIVRQYDALYDRFITRADVIYGAASLYPQTASRVLSN